MGEEAKQVGAMGGVSAGPLRYAMTFMTLSGTALSRLAKTLAVLVATAALLACSAVRLAYNNLPEFSYWWLDGYLDLNGAQSLRVRDELNRLLAWHRRNELPRLAALLARAQALAPQDLSPGQACELVEAIRERLLAVARQAEPAGTELALSLNQAQLRQLESKYAKSNAAYRKEWLELRPQARLDKRYEQLLERNEDFYGDLDAAQRALLRQQVTQSSFSPPMLDTERKRRQQEALALLRRLLAEPASPAEARAALHAYVTRVAVPDAGSWREHQQALLQEGCHNLAALHNTTSAAQRDRAVRRLRAYEDDLRELANGA